MAATAAFSHTPCAHLGKCNFLGFLVRACAIRAQQRPCFLLCCHCQVSASGKGNDFGMSPGLWSGLCLGSAKAQGLLSSRVHFRHLPNSARIATPTAHRRPWSTGPLCRPPALGQGPEGSDNEEGECQAIKHAAPSSAAAGSLLMLWHSVR